MTDVTFNDIPVLVKFPHFRVLGINGDHYGVFFSKDKAIDTAIDSYFLNDFVIVDEDIPDDENGMDGYAIVYRSPSLT